MEQISYAEFAKLEIKIGTILSVEIVPEADKLLRLMVNVGEENPRQIISGIRENNAIKFLWCDDKLKHIGRQRISS